MKTLRIQTLGRLRFTLDGTTDVRLPTRKAASLAVYLAVHPDKRFARETLAELFWGDSQEYKARHSLSQAILHIRGVLGEQRIRVDGESVWMCSADVEVDTLAVLDIFRKSQAGSSENPSTLFLGEFLEQGELGQESYDEWLRMHRANVRRTIHLSLAEALAAFHAEKDNAGKLRTAQAIIGLDPFDEGAHRAVMQALVAQGQAAMAQEHYEQFQRFLNDEMGVEPEQQTAALYRSIRTGRAIARNVSSSLSDFAFILEQLPNPVVITDTASRIIGWNKSSEATFGKVKDEVYGLTPSTVFGESVEKKYQRDSDEVFRRAVREGKWLGHVKVRSSDGSVAYARRMVSPLYTPTGELIGAIGQEIPDTTALHMPGL